MNFKNIWIYLRTNSGTFGAEMAKAGRFVQTFGKIADDGNRKAGLFGKSWLSVGSMIKVGLTVASVAMGLFVAKAAQFEREMRNVNSISYMSERQLAAVSQEVLNLSATLPQSATTAAAGLYQIASSGFAGAQGLDVLKASMEAASAGLSTTETAATAITASLNAYGLRAQDAGKISDILFQTVNLGVVTFEELAQNLGDVVGISATAGLGLEQVGAAIATITRAGIPAAETTTSLNRLIQSMLDPSEALAAAAERLGINFSRDLRDPARGLLYVMEKLRDVAGDNVNVWLQWFPEIRAARGAFALAADGGNIAREVFAQFTDEAKLAGTTQRALAEQSKGLTFQLGLLRNNIEKAAITLGMKIIPYLTQFVKDIRQGTGQVGAFAQDLARMGKAGFEAFMAIASVIGPVVLGLARLTAIGAGAVLGALADTMGFLARGLKAAQPVVAVVAGMLLGRLVPSLAATALGFLNLQRIRIAIMFLKIRDAIVQSLTAMTAMQALNVAGMLGGAAIAGFAIMWQRAGEAAEEYRKQLKRDTGTPKNLEDFRRAQEHAAKEVARLQKEQEKLAEGRGIWKSLTGDTVDYTQAVLNNRRALNAAMQEEERLSTGMLNHARNIKIMHDATGATSETLEVLAQRVGVNLSRAVDQSSPARMKIYNELNRIASQAGLTGQQLDKMISGAADPTAMAEKIEKVGKAMDKTAEAFRGDFDIFDRFNEQMEDGEGAAERLASAQENVAAATERLRDAHAQAAEEVKRNNQAIRDAEEGVARANERSEQAQIDLTRARQQANDEIREMGRNLQRLALDERGAALAVAEARQRLNEVRRDPKATNLERKRAKLSYDEAKFNEEDIRNRRREANEEYAEAQRKGIEGSERVVAANKEIAESEKERARATEELNRAHEEAKRTRDDVRKAEEELRKAHEELRKAQIAAAEAALPAAERLRRVLEQAMADQDKFVRLVREGILRGLDPNLIAAALAKGPKEAAPLLEAMLSDHSGRLSGMYGNFVQNTDMQTEALRQNTKILEMALTGAAGNMSEKWREAIEINRLALEGLNVEEIARRMKMTPEQVREIAEPFGIAVEEAKRSVTGKVQVILDSIRQVGIEWGQGAFKTREAKDKISENLDLMIGRLKDLEGQSGVSFTQIQKDLIKTAEDAKTPEEKINALQLLVDTFGKTEARPTLGLNEAEFNKKIIDAYNDANTIHGAVFRPSLGLDTTEFYRQIEAALQAIRGMQSDTGAIQATPRRQADGGIMRFYAEGHVAQIAPANVMRVWAEPETGGEAYIPLAASKRARSLSIWRETGRLLGVRGFQAGGFTQPRVRMQAGGILASGGPTTVNVNVTAHFGPGSNADDLRRAMRSIAQNEVTDAMMDVERRRRARV